MQEKKLYIISGCNGAGKTTASFNILPDLLNCKEFVNADEIARGLSPFKPESVSIEAGRLMLKRIKELINSNQDFSFETTLSSKSFIKIIDSARSRGYYITLIFFWLESIELAKDRVKKRVSEGGHNIETDVIERRYKAGIKNLFKLYCDKVDSLLIYDNSKAESELIAEKEIENDFFTVHHSQKFNALKMKINEQERERNSEREN
ncbi:MAG: zeta toxin family protein [Bacteroidota bacterium]|jgi:predicted ABC-type ATPase